MQIILLLQSWPTTLSYPPTTSNILSISVRLIKALCAIILLFCLLGKGEKVTNTFASLITGVVLLLVRQGTYIYASAKNYVVLSVCLCVCDFFYAFYKKVSLELIVSF